MIGDTLSHPWRGLSQILHKHTGEETRQSLTSSTQTEIRAQKFLSLINLWSVHSNPNMT